LVRRRVEISFRLVSCSKGDSTASLMRAAIGSRYCWE